MALLVFVSVFAGFVFSKVNAATVSYKTTDLAGYVNVNEGSVLRVRSDPSTDSEILENLPRGTVVQIYGETSVGNIVWYYVEYPVPIDGEGGEIKRYGYCSSEYVKLVTKADDPAFEKKLDEQKFPENYRAYLRVLHALHPNWIFNSFNPGITWKELIDGEMYGNRSLISVSGNPTSWFRFTPDNYRFEADEWVRESGGEKTFASEELIAFYADPRNFLNDRHVFQFELLTFNENVAKTEYVNKVLSGTFMDNALIPGGDDDNNGKDITYAEAFLKLGRELNVNPLMLATRVRQEQGSGKSEQITGHVSGYEGYYNFFNIEASGTTAADVLKSGMEEAKKEGWTSPYLAIKGGSIKFANNYVLKGQDTLYLQRFDVDDSYFGRYWHQYMQNTKAAAKECLNVRGSYVDSGLIDSTFVFKIPVYNDMPSISGKLPWNTGNVNNRLKSLTVSGATLSPSFSHGTFSYITKVSNTVKSVTITATPFNSREKVSGAGTLNLTESETTVNVSVKSEYGVTQVYKIIIQKTEPSTPTASPTANPTIKPTVKPTATPTVTPTAKPTPTPTAKPTPTPVVSSYKTTLSWSYNQNIDKDLIYNIPEGSTVKAVKSQFTLTAATISVTDKDGNELPDNAVIATNHRINIISTTTKNAIKKFTVVIFGDVNGDGRISSLDFVLVKRHVWDISKLSGVYLIAGCSSQKSVSGMSSINSLDFVYIKRHVWAISKISQAK